MAKTAVSEEGAQTPFRIFRQVEVGLMTADVGFRRCEPTLALIASRAKALGVSVAYSSVVITRAALPSTRKTPLGCRDKLPEPTYIQGYELRPPQQRGRPASNWVGTSGVDGKDQLPALGLQRIA